MFVRIVIATWLRLVDLVLKGDSASGIFTHMMRKEEDFAVIRGSTFEEDKNEEYCYLMLSDIILHMEMGRYVDLVM